ncbi:hypothetical protein HanIR_Chr14g0677731 [Helianthus annuus]|nr:hypothetical protein HanIR_Chr14g0677731 [Helianthus annuus]
MFFRVLLISLQEWVSSLKTRYKAYGFLVLYRILGRLLGHHCPTLQQMVLLLWKWLKAVF